MVQTPRIGDACVDDSQNEDEMGFLRSGCPPHPDLVKKPFLCIEYVVLHELIHFFEANHTPRFQALLTAHMPMWEHLKDVLNQAPLGEEVWEEMTE